MQITSDEIWEAWSHIITNNSKTQKNVDLSKRVEQLETDVSKLESINYQNRRK